MSRDVRFSTNALDDLEWWLKNDKRLAQRTLDLIREAARTPFEGTGKPEPLKGDLSGFWSRRIDREHRVVYQASEETIYVLQCRFHY
jgi:toxin YoeB